MLTRQFENPFHTVVLGYDETRNETEYEKELVKRYLHFLEQQQEKRTVLNKLTNMLNYEHLFVDEALLSHEKLEGEFREIAEIIERFKTERFIIPDAMFSLRDRFHAAIGRYFEYHANTVDILRNHMEAGETEFNKLYAWFEDEEDGKAYDEVDDFAGELYKNYNNYSLDLCYFDDDVESMKGEWQKLSGQWDEVFNLREETVKYTKKYCDKIEQLNKTATDLQSDFDEMNNEWSAFNN